MQDSLVQTVRQVQAAFEALLDILELQAQLGIATGSHTAASGLHSFLQSTSSTLLAIGMVGLSLTGGDHYRVYDQDQRTSVLSADMNPFC